MEKTIRELGRVMGQVMAEMTTREEQESWNPKEHVYYRVTITAAATATFHRLFGFSREIAGHDSTCCTMPDGTPRTISRADGSKTAYCLHGNSRISDEEAMSLVRKGQGSVYKVIEHSQRLK